MENNRLFGKQQAGCAKLPYIDLSLIVNVADASGNFIQDLWVGT